LICPGNVAVLESHQSRTGWSRLDGGWCGVCGKLVRMGLLGARALTKQYGSVGALAGVTLDVDRGDFVAVMGPSGSGKSTLLHLLGGLDTATSGDVLFDERLLSSLDDDARADLRRHRIGFVFQSFNLVPVLTAAENVSLPAVIDGQHPRTYAAQLDEVLELVGLDDARDRLPSELSGGQQQRVALARALFIGPDVLLADEPTGNLDSRTGLDLMTAIADLNHAQGVTVVIVTHDPAVAAYARDVVLLRDGRITGRLSLDGEGGDRAQVVVAWLQDCEAASRS
jgi:putative ABC transport system ATP-binding protein